MIPKRSRFGRNFIRSFSRLPAIWALACLFASSIFLPALLAHAEEKIPPAPTYYVLDEPKVLQEQTLRALQSLLVEHDRVTGEQVIVAVFESLNSGELVDRTNRIFQEWKIGRRDKDNGVLLALYWKEHKARIEVGYGLEPVLTDAKAKRILEDFLIPELKTGQSDRALSLASLEILRALESPLIRDGKAEQILKAGGFRGDWGPTQAGVHSSAWVGLAILGILFLSIVINWLSAADAHFSGAGWYRPRPWRRGAGIGGWGGSGGLGGGGWGGGFGGGGGSSGGGGASGSW